MSAQMFAFLAPEVRGRKTQSLSPRRVTALAAVAVVAVRLCWPASAETPRQLLPATDANPPTFALEQLEGAPLDLAALRGSTVLVHFFATWCEPCKAEFAALAQFAAHRPAIKIVAIDVGEPAERVRKFARAEGVTLPILLDGDRKVTRSWRVTILPTTFVLDETLTARLFVEGDLDWSADSTLAAIDAVTAAPPTTQLTTQPTNEGKRP